MFDCALISLGTFMFFLVACTGSISKGTAAYNPNHSGPITFEKLNDLPPGETGFYYQDSFDETKDSKLTNVNPFPALYFPRSAATRRK